MLRLNNETKVGILAVVSIAIAIWGFLYLKGRNVLSSSKTFYVRYENAGQLRPSSPVFISGFQVGTVKDMYLDDKDDRTIIAVLSVESGIDIPKNAIAGIVSQSMMGGKSVEITFNQPCEGANCAESGDYLEGSSKSFLQTMIGSPDELDAYTSRIKFALTSIYDSITDPRDPQGIGKMLLNMDATVANLNASTAALKALLAANTASITATTANLGAITGSFRESNAQIKSLLANADAFSAQLKAANFDKTGQKASGAIDSLTLAIASIKSTLGGLDRAVGSLDGVLKGVSGGKGSLGKLATDPQLYENLERGTRHLTLLLQDFRLNPKRYTRISLMGKRKNYANPIDDPAYFRMIDSLERAYEKQRLLKK